MKRIAVTLLLLSIWIVPARGHDGAVTVRITSGNGEAVVVLDDNAVSRDFVSLLPLALCFSDFAGAEKIAPLPRKLRTLGNRSPDNAEGDFAYYAPWGNLAVFYRGSGKSGDLFIMGRIVSGKEWLGTLGENALVHIAIVR